MVGSDLSLPVQVQGYIDDLKVSLPFSDCRRLSVEISSTDGSTFNVSAESEVGKRRENSWLEKNEGTEYGWFTIQRSLD